MEDELEVVTDKLRAEFARAENLSARAEELRSSLDSTQQELGTTYTVLMSEQEQRRAAEERCDTLMARLHDSHSLQAATEAQLEEMVRRLPGP